MLQAAEAAKISELMERIRAELAERQQPGLRGVDAGAVSRVALAPMPHARLAKPEFVVRDSYVLGDFLALHDEDFISAAYRGVLKRMTDPSGATHFLDGLRSGQVSKIEILGRLRYSPEGRKLQVPVRGLAGAYFVQRLYRLPVVGFFLALGSAALRLPRIVRNLQTFENYQHQRNAEITSLLVGVTEAAGANERRLVDAVSESAREVREHGTRLADLGVQHARGQARTSALDARLGDLQESVRGATREFADAVQESARAAQQSMRTLQESLDARLSTEVAAVQSRLSAAETHLATLEGTRLGIADRLDALESAASRIDSAETRLGAIEAATQGIDHRVSAVEAGTSRIAAAETRLASIEAAGGPLSHRLAELEASASRIASAETRLTELETVGQQLNQRMAQEHAKVQHEHTNLREHVLGIDARMSGLSQTLHAEQGAAQLVRQRLAERLARVEGRIHEQGLMFNADNGRPVDTGEKAPKKKAAAGSAPSRFDALYVAFENRFRGAREDIRQRLAYYLPLLRASAVGQEGAAVLDVGCGRGEWLELLRDEKISARGIDINESMVAACRERRLQAVVGDVIAQLKRIPDNTLGAVTGFHIIEHLSLDTLIELTEQAHRVVQPGGIVIFETPNPENLVVGACGFYTDPTHQRPLPPTMMQFLVESAGFVDVQIHRVNASLLPKLFDEPDANDPPALRSALSFLHSAFLCAPDYSVIGRVE